MKLFRNLTFWIALAVLGALLAQLLIQDPGFVLVRYRGIPYETTLAATVIALLAAVLGAWLLWRLLSFPFRLWRLRRERNARARLGDGLDALHQGHYARAEKLLSQAAQDKQFEATARTAAARAAQARGDADAAAAHLHAIAERHPATRAIAIAKAALKDGRNADAIAALDTLSGPLPPRGAVLRADALAASGQAGQAYGMLGALRQQQALTAPELAERERRWAEQALRSAADANALADLWDALPAVVRNQAPVVTAYADRAVDLRWDDAAAKSLEHALDAQWDDRLAAHYGGLPIERLDGAAIEQRRAKAERWLQAHPASAGALLGLARLARAQGQWPQAERFLHRAIAQGGGGEGWEELGHGFVQRGDDGSARRCYANALRAARGEAAEAIPGRDLKQRIEDEAAIEERDAHGLPRLRG